jgi:short-subunit dehydrogenase
VLVARRKERLEELAKELTELHSLEVFVRATDLTDLADCGAMIDEATEKLGSIDVLVNNAGFGDMGAFDLADWAKIERMIQVDVVALTYLTHRVYPGMVERKRGGILNISSGFGLQFLPGFAAYVGSKHFVTGFTDSLHVEARAFGITVTQVCPGPVKTEFDEVAGNFTGTDVPSVVRITASHCARSALAGFARGRALVVPGFVMKLLMFLGAYSPRWFRRLFHRPAAAWLRRRELAARAAFVEGRRADR